MTDAAAKPPANVGAAQGGGVSKGDKKKATAKKPKKPTSPIDSSTPPTPRAPPQRQFAKTDTGNAERLAYYCGRQFRYVEEWDEFLVWRGTHWQRDPQHVRVGALTKDVIAHIREEAKAWGINTDQGKSLYAHSLDSQKRPRREAMTALVRSEPGVTISHEKLDANSWLLNCKNGIVDLKTGELRLVAPTDLVTRCIDARFDKKAKAPSWLRFLERVMPDQETRDFLQRFIGYALTGDVGERVFIICYGGGRNGKSVLLRIVQALLGRYSTTCAPGLLMARKDEAHPADVADLFGARLAVASEVKKGRTFDEEKVKRITGNDMLKARRMRENFWEFLPTHKIILATNHKPRVADATDSFWDRLALIKFDVRITDEEVERDLAERIVATELSGVLAWAMEGCLAWQKGGLRLPAAIKAATKEYRESEDVVGAFVAECCLFDKSTFTTTAGLMTAANRWCLGNERYPFSKKDLAEWLSQHECEQGKSKAGDSRGWRGIRLKNMADLKDADAKKPN